MKKYFFLTFLVFTIFSCNKEELNSSERIVFVKQYGGERWDKIISMVEKDDAIFLLNESSEINTGEFMFLIKCNSNGDSLWSKRYLSNDEFEEFAKSIISLPDNFLLIGETCNISGTPNGVVIIKTDFEGNEVLTKKFFLNNYLSIKHVNKDSNGDIVICGTSSTCGFLMKLNEALDTLWTKRICFDKNMIFNNVIETNDNNYLIAGYLDGPNGASTGDAYLIKTNLDGDTLWTKGYGFIEKNYKYCNYSYASSIIETNDNNYIVCGQIIGQIRDILAFKIDNDGDLIWYKNYGYSDYDIGNFTVRTSNNEYVIMGNSEVQNLNWQIFLVKLNNSGDDLWKNNFGTQNTEMGNVIIESSNNSLIIGGEIHDKNGIDIYLTKIQIPD